jgi:hypothetical protein
MSEAVKKVSSRSSRGAEEYIPPFPCKKNLSSGHDMSSSTERQDVNFPETRD